MRHINTSRNMSVVRCGSSRGFVIVYVCVFVKEGGPTREDIEECLKASGGLKRGDFHPELMPYDMSGVIGAPWKRLEEEKRV